MIFIILLIILFFIIGTTTYKIHNKRAAAAADDYYWDNYGITSGLCAILCTLFSIILLSETFIFVPIYKKVYVFKYFDKKSDPIILEKGFNIIYPWEYKTTFFDLSFKKYD